MISIRHSQLIIRNPKGNISLIMIFVLAIGAIMGLMSTNFLQNMIRETSALKTSYQSYYIAKGGIELGDLVVNRYDYGFEDILLSGSTIFTNNFSCGTDCRVEVKIHSLITGGKIGHTPTIITNCSNENALWLSGGASQILPLFVDTRKISNTSTNSIKNILSDYNLSLESANNMPGDVGVGLVLSTGNQLSYDQQDISAMQKLYITGSVAGLNITNNLLKNPQNIANNGIVSQTINSFNYGDPYNYLAITNIGSDNLGICLNFSPNNTSKYPLDTSVIYSTASYKNSSLSLQSVVKKELPDYVYNSYQGG